MFSLTCRNNFLVIALKKYAETALERLPNLEVLRKPYLACWVQVKIDFRTQSTFVGASMFIDRPNLGQTARYVHKFESFLKTEEARETFSDCFVHNVREFYKVLVQFLFTISEMELDLQYKKLYLLVSLRVAGRLKTTQEIRKYQGNSKLQGDTVQAPVSPKEINFWYQHSKKTQK